MIESRGPAPAGAGPDPLGRSRNSSTVRHEAAEPSCVGFTLTTRLVGPGCEARQVQYATDRYVVTCVEGTTVVYLRDRNERFLSMPGTRTLRRMDPGGDAGLPAAVSASLALARVDWAPESIRLDGRTGRSGILHIDNPAHVIEAEITIVRVPGLEETALGRERACTDSSQWLDVDLSPDECIASLRTRILSRGFHHRQAMELLSVEPSIDQRELLDDVQRFLTDP
ncbi:MAG: hypothetical protein AMXMBFR53_25750 [Gemmatimonadota bacterium]